MEETSKSGPVFLQVDTRVSSVISRVRRWRDKVEEGSSDFEDGLLFRSRRDLDTSLLFYEGESSYLDIYYCSSPTPRPRASLEIKYLYGFSSSKRHRGPFTLKGVLT